MLTEKQLKEIREHLEKAQNPVFFYDNDTDGLCSFLILRRFTGRGNGVIIKNYPDLNASYAHKANELNADYIFVLDKPVIGTDFINEINAVNIPVVWIDHHDISKNEPSLKSENIHIYNPAKNRGKNKSSEPVTYLAYKIANRKEDLWLAMIGCISDNFMPDFAGEFAKHYPELWGSIAKIKKPFDAYFRTEIGKTARDLNFSLKDSASHIIQLQNFLISCRTPADILNEIEINETFRQKYSEVKKRYEILIEQAKNCISRDLIFFSYSGEISMSGELANELYYMNPESHIVIAYRKSAYYNISMRGKNARKILMKMLDKFESATGGGHDEAVGARIKVGDLARFKDELEKEVKKEE